MDLETFVAETIEQIVKGVKTAQQSKDCDGASVNPKGYVKSLASGQRQRAGDPKPRENEFDVALMVVEGSEKKAGLTV